MSLPPTHAPDALESSAPASADESRAHDAAATRDVLVASDDDVRKAIKRITRDHGDLIKALAK